jgi:hypothetical protein
VVILGSLEQRVAKMRVEPARRRKAMALEAVYKFKQSL